ncbi:MAG: sigma-54-dependent Fis family transcriptional regulator, partial [Planctomycetaceae bacterium]|nr:sigma-54-dependent Fis family transcriptional regulator [Planctomycetaceae bacterium]
QEGKFRSDLFYRLNGFTIELPPVRERGEDIRLLLEHFLAHFRNELHKTQVEGIADETLALLMNYSWPGNVREMQSVVRQALLNATGPVIVPDCLPPEIRNGKAAPAPAPAAAANDDLPESDLGAFIDRRLPAGTTDLYAESMHMLERYLLTRVLRETGGNQSKAAQILGITRGKIRDRIAAFGIKLEHGVHLDAE